MGSSIAIIDYCKGNLASVQRCLADLGYDATITDRPEQIRAADGLVLPGVGAFADAMGTMDKGGLSDAVRDAVADGVPFLGICLGLHLLFDWGDEGVPEGERMDGLGLLPGHVERMASHDAAGTKFKIPHVGWNSVDFTERGAENPLFAGVSSHEYFYFTHSYCAVPDDPADIIATTEHAERFCSGVNRGMVFGVQFHPEKSSRLGFKVFGNFGHIVDAQSSRI